MTRFPFENSCLINLKIKSRKCFRIISLKKIKSEVDESKNLEHFKNYTSIITKSPGRFLFIIIL